MCCETMSVSGYSKGKRSTIRLAALLACVLLVAAMLLSSAYILIHANHTHDHDGPDGECATCMHIQSAENLLKRLSTAVAPVTVVLGGLLGILFSLKAVLVFLSFQTLVALKVRLNN